eukprot:TRINITY_DN1265_c0_g1_i2.p1 TRINITY_DN1265_c0_g1~~TRINITY_DN1265_c0_g1_i2.p1  ORF type:complete len:314 (+),score=69.79 TRINITY_DN1265_c0_g1_i2:63-944(+)
MNPFSILRPVDQVFGQAFLNTFGFPHTSFIFSDPPGTFQSDIPLSQPIPVLSITIGYFLTIYLLHSYMKSRPAFNLKPLFAIHNAFLSAISLILFLLLVEAVGSKWWEHGLRYTVCSPRMFDDRRLEVYYYINYLIKYYELIDTLFLVLMKKPLEFLHVYHHSATMLLCYSQLIGNTTVQWVPITLNLFVHVVMYYYYARVALGARIWWKKYLTTLQILQFIIDLWAVYYCTFTHYFMIWFPAWGFQDCHGKDVAAWIGCFVLSSYLLLFVQFFQKTYSDRRAAAAAARAKKD